MTPPRRIGIVGLGLIGGSIARRLVRCGVEVVGWDTDEATRRAAAAVGVEVPDAMADVCAGGVDVVFLAVPLRALDTVVPVVAEAAATHVVVSDVGSVKGPVTRMMRDAGLAHRYVGTHPMAGTEESGFGASTESLLHDAAWAVTLEAETPYDGVLAVLHLVTRHFAGRVHCLRDQEHDEAVALVSHLPHVLATELLNLAGRSHGSAVALGLAAGSFRDGTRVAGTNPARTEAMVAENAPWVVPAIRSVVADLGRLADSLEAGTDVSAFFREGSAIAARRRAPTGEPGYVELAPGAADWRERLLAVGERGGVVTSVDGQRARFLG